MLGVPMAEFWEAWGALAYVFAAAWAFFEGETFVIVAAAAGRATGYIDPWLLMVSVWIGSFAGDQTWFYLGRRWGPSALARFPKAADQFARASDMLERHGALFVLSFRFIYGIRNVASAVCGIAGMDRRRFLALNFLAAGLWAASFVAGGWFLGAAFEEGYAVWMLGAVALAIAAFLAYRSIRSRRTPPASAFTPPLRSREPLEVAK
jgi:membrane protein DedA with SNARE-associated domain